MQRIVENGATARRTVASSSMCSHPSAQRPALQSAHDACASSLVMVFLMMYVFVLCGSKICSVLWTLLLVGFRMDINGPLLVLSIRRGVLVSDLESCEGVVNCLCDIGTSETHNAARFGSLSPVLRVLREWLRDE